MIQPINPAALRAGGLLSCSIAETEDAVDVITLGPNYP
jgi:hypothetical protein